MAYYELSASAFSEEIDFNRSTISHLLSGRNKPSLDFVMKVLKRFPEVTVSWFLYGKGEFPPSIENPTIKVDADKKNRIEELHDKSIPDITKSTTPKSDKDVISKSVDAMLTEKKIKRIVIFYTDSSFESYEN